MRHLLNVLVTGGGGYLGTVLVPMLLKRGHAVTVVDRFFWNQQLLNPSVAPALKLITADTRSLSESVFKGVDAVIDLAALSNDPIGELKQQITLDINHTARVRTATMAKKAGVKKYILASSCSVYGFRDAILDETSALAPVTTYAKASMLAERDTLALADKNFSVTALRQGTLYGLSPRMRFDLVVNTMALSLLKNNAITVSGGSQWRPLVHVEDSAQAFIQIMHTDAALTSGQIFNVGSDQQNYQITDLAKLIQKAIPQATHASIITNDIQTDFRSYRVAFTKIEKTIDFKTIKTPAVGAREVYEALEAGHITDSIETKTIDWYKHLLAQNPKILENLG
jgi:nucleoside-diphosphate-sugar epimerase